MGEKIKNTLKGAGSFGSKSGVNREYKLPPTSPSSSETPEKIDNEFGRGAKLGLGFGSLCSVCGSIFASSWLFNQPEGFIEGKNSVTTSLEGLNAEYTALKNTWEGYKQKHETLITSELGLLKKIAELEKNIEEFRNNIEENIKKLLNQSSGKK